MKSVIYEFDPVIYPTRLWVCKKPDAKDVEALFYPFDSNGNVVDSYGDTFDNPDSFANTIIVGNKKSRWRGCLKEGNSAEQDRAKAEWYRNKAEELRNADH